MIDDTDNLEKDVFLTPNQLIEKHSWPKGGIRHLLFQRRTNGLDHAVRKIGRKILIKEKDFLLWLDSHKEER